MFSLISNQWICACGAICANLPEARNHHCPAVPLIPILPPPKTMITMQVIHDFKELRKGEEGK